MFTTQELNTDGLFTYFVYLQEEELILISNYKFLLLFLGERNISVSILNTIWIG
jgi:hypothetical protein